MTMSIFWTALAIVLILAEASTAYLVCIWFAGGALAALICSLISDIILLQITVFVLVTAALLIATKPIVKKIKNTDNEKTNIDAILGKTALVTESISNINATGTAKLDGKLWSARSATGEDIPEGQLVTVKQIDGVKLIVINKEEE